MQSPISDNKKKKDPEHARKHARIENIATVCWVAVWMIRLQDSFVPDHFTERAKADGILEAIQVVRSRLLV